MTPEQLARFIVGAKTVAGMSDAQVAAALQVPALITGTPVLALTSLKYPAFILSTGKVMDPAGGTVATLEKKLIPSPSKPLITVYPAQDAGGGGGGGSCGGTVTGTVSYYNVHNTRLASFALSKFWECDWTANVTNAPPASVKPDITQYGYSMGWEYVGTDERTNHFYTWGGSSRGGHRSRASGNFRACNSRWGCYSGATPWVEINAHFDESFSASGGD